MAYSENDIILPTLHLLADSGENGLTTTAIKDKLGRVLDLSSADLEILSGRKDSHFSQIVRNLVSHNTLVRKGLATYKPGQPSGTHYITQKGVDVLMKHVDEIDFLIDGGFNEEEKEDILDTNKEILIEEGYITSSTRVNKRARSKKLTVAAREHFSVDGIVRCSTCKFSFDEYYGPTARNYIEIHHIKPIFMYESDDISRTISEAMDNLAPLCANCHRFIHRHSPVITPTEVKVLISNFGRH